MYIVFNEQGEPYIARPRFRINQSYEKNVESITIRRTLSKIQQSRPQAKRYVEMYVGGMNNRPD